MPGKVVHTTAGVYLDFRRYWPAGRQLAEHSIQYWKWGCWRPLLSVPLYPINWNLPIAQTIAVSGIPLRQELGLL